MRPGGLPSFLILCVVVLALYGHTLQNGYLIDDGSMIFFAHQTTLDNLHEFLGPAGDIYWRPLPGLILMVDSWIWGLGAFGPRLTNLLLLVLLGMAARRLALAASLEPDRALIVGLLAVANPFAADAALWIMARYDLLAAACSLMALACAVRSVKQGTNWQTLAATGLWTLLALASKEVAFVLPGLVLLYALAARPKGTRIISRNIAAPTAVSFAVLAVVIIVRIALLGRVGGPQADPGTISGLVGLKNLVADLPQSFLAPVHFGMFEPQTLVWMVRAFFVTWAVILSLILLNRKSSWARIGFLAVPLAALPSAMYGTFSTEAGCFYRLPLPVALGGFWIVGALLNGRRARKLGAAAIAVVAGLSALSTQGQTRMNTIISRQMSDVVQAAVRLYPDPKSLDRMIFINMPSIVHGQVLALDDIRGFFMPLWGFDTPEMMSANERYIKRSTTDFRKTLQQGRLALLAFAPEPARIVDLTEELHRAVQTRRPGEPIIFDFADSTVPERVEPKQAVIDREEPAGMRLVPRFGMLPGFKIDDPGIDASTHAAVVLRVTSEWKKPCTAKLAWSGGSYGGVADGFTDVPIPPGGPTDIEIPLELDPRWHLAGRPGELEVQLLSGGTITFHRMSFLPYSD